MISSAQPPAKFGDYKVRRLLGSGMQGETYLAEDPAGRLVAVKTIRVEEIATRKARSALDLETVVLRAAGSAYTPEFITHGTEDDRPYYVMEFIEGITVENILASRGSLDDVATQRLAVRLAAILTGLHSVGIAHGDFRPQNLIVSEDGGVYVLDFGRAALRSESRSRFKQRRRSDLRQLGELIVRARTGRLPFGEDSSLAIERYNEGRPDAGTLAGRTRSVALSLLQRPSRWKRPPSAKTAHRILVHGRRARWRVWSGMCACLICLNTDHEIETAAHIVGLLT